MLLIVAWKALHSWQGQQQHRLHHQQQLLLTMKTEVRLLLLVLLLLLLLQMMTPAAAVVGMRAQNLMVCGPLGLHYDVRMEVETPGKKKLLLLVMIMMMKVVMVVGISPLLLLLLSRCAAGSVRLLSVLAWLQTSLEPDIPAAAY
jgi:hypothetical protein